MADIPVNRTSQEELGPAKENKPDDRVQIVQGNTPVLTIQLLASINKNIIELGKKLDVLTGIAKGD